MASETTPLVVSSPSTQENEASTYISTPHTEFVSKTCNTDENSELTRRLKQIGLLWQKCIAPLWLIALIALPMIIFRKENEYWEWLKYTCYAPISGILACSIPSGGAPVAGGIVFLPILTMMGIEPHQAVAFAAATQTFGVGIFTPMGWLYRDPSVIMMKGFLIPFFPIAVAGLATGLLVLPLKHSDEVLWAFTIFIIILATYTARGLIKNELKGTEKVAPSLSQNYSSEVVDIENNECQSAKTAELIDDTLPLACNRDLTYTPLQFAIYAICIFSGGILTSWIGIGVEKITFLLLTAIHDVDVVAAGLSSITLTGWLSLVASGFHALCAPPDDGPGPHWICAPTWGDHSFDSYAGYVSGNIPYKLLLAVLPGTMIGSLVGPRINAAVGPRNIMILFVIFLIFDIVTNIVDLLG